MQNIKKYKLKPFEKRTLAEKLGLNKIKTSFNIKTKHSNTLQKKLTSYTKIQEEKSMFNAFHTKLKNYKHFRNINGYPSRGQRTHTNAKTKKKNRAKSLP